MFFVDEFYSELLPSKTLVSYIGSIGRYSLRMIIRRPLSKTMQNYIILLCILHDLLLFALVFVLFTINLSISLAIFWSVTWA